MQCGMHFVLSFLLHQRNGEFLQSFDKVNIIPTYRCSMYLLGIMGTKNLVQILVFCSVVSEFGEHVKRSDQTDRQTLKFLQSCSGVFYVDTR